MECVASFPFANGNTVSKVVADYYNGKPELTPFYSFPPGLLGVQKYLTTKVFPSVNRSVLVSVLRDQYSNFPASEKTLQNIESLLNENTFTITTGHQLCLMGGPLYFFYKIASAISLAKELNTLHTDKKVVPVFWMASEDHDFAEINHFYLFNKKVEWKCELSGGPVGRMLLTETESLAGQIKQILGNLPGGQLLLDLFGRHYSNGKSLSEATRGLVNELFGQHGLVILDADNARLKELFIPVMRADLFQHSTYHAANETTAELKNGGYQAQIEARPVNLFYFAEGRRSRIEKQGENFIVLNSSLVFTPAQMHKQLEETPGNFSPNVVLRPVYQETILPNLVYFGGPGELAYWFQLSKVFKVYQIPYPVLLMRSSFFLTDANSWEKFQSLGFTSTDLFREENDLIKSYMNQTGYVDETLQNEKEQITSLYLLLKHKLELVEKTLAASTEAELQKTLGGLTNLEAKYNKARKQKHESQVTIIKRLKDKLFPGGSPQERVEGIGAFYVKNQQFLDQLMEQIPAIPANSAILIGV